jgi:chain length determinant protein (polysaccharide antigen chain regulator)
MQQSDQEIYPYQTDEIDLKVLFNSLVARKFLIAGLTGFVTLFAIIVVLNLTPIYQATSSFTSPSKISIIKINSARVSNESNTSVFTNFLTKLSSEVLQKKVFLDGGYLSAFNPQKNTIDNVDSFINNALKSVKIIPPNITSKELKLGFLTELPYSISIEGDNTEVISRYLNELVATADKIVIFEFFAVNKQHIEIRLNEISIESRLLLIKAKQLRLNEIAVLTEAAKIARSLGIIENNFKLISGDKINSNLTIAIGENKDLPQWYLYGEKALLERVELLESRISDEHFIPKLVALNNEKLLLESHILDSTNVNAIKLNQVAFPSEFPIKPNKRMIVLLAFIGSFMMSIFLALVMDAFKPHKNAIS